MPLIAASVRRMRDRSFLGSLWSPSDAGFGRRFSNWTRKGRGEFGALPWFSFVNCVERVVGVVEEMEDDHVRHLG